jgi:hypothetical protein
MSTPTIRGRSSTYLMLEVRHLTILAPPRALGSQSAVR